MLLQRTDEPRRNPFRFGDVATGEHFTDRKAEIAELVRDLRSGQSVLVISPRRYGKTSLITAVLERVHKQHILAHRLGASASLVWVWFFRGYWSEGRGCSSQLLALENAGTPNQR
jgi:hypothetical protein